MDIRTDTDSLPTADGLMPAYVCRPATGGPYPAVIVVMEAFGLNAHIKAVAERVAREGYVTIAPDFFYRFGSPIVPYEDVSRAIGYIQRFDDAALMAEMGVVIQHLKSLAEVRGDRIGITGFCVGGRIAFLTACRHPAAVKVAIAFYGGGIAADTPTAPLHDASRIQCPVLCLFGEADRMTEQTSAESGALVCLGHRDVHQLEGRLVQLLQRVHTDDIVVALRDPRQRVG